jgi:formylmethanofuran dehydrogenase subunit D
MAGINVILLTGRSISQGVGKEKGKLSEDYASSVAVCEIDPNDLNRLGVTEGEHIRVSNEHGSIVLRAVESKRGPHQGIVYIPYGLWANALIGAKTDGTGMPSFKGVPAYVEPAPGHRVTGLRDLIKDLYAEGKLRDDSK